MNEVTYHKLVDETKWLEEEIASIGRGEVRHFEARDGQPMVDVTKDYVERLRRQLDFLVGRLD